MDRRRFLAGVGLFTAGGAAGGALAAEPGLAADGPTARTAAPPWPGAYATTVLFRASPSARLVALTFDDGPTRQWTPRVLAILRRHGAKATFFRVGQRAQAAPDLNMPVGSIAARGSHVPHRRLIRARATFMPDTAWPGPQAPARLIPGQDPGPGSDAVHTLSALRQWFTRVRLPGSHLTHHVRLFRSAHHPGSFTGAACGGFGPLPA